jgi:hypothetical protein
MMLYPFFRWTVILFMASLIFLMLIIIRHYNAVTEIQQKLYDHSEIVDTV